MTETGFTSATVVSTVAVLGAQFSPDGGYIGLVILILGGATAGVTRALSDADDEKCKETRFAPMVGGGASGVFFCCLAYLLIDLWPVFGGMVNRDAPRPEPISGLPRYGLPMIVGYAHQEASALILAIFGKLTSMLAKKSRAND